jgi:antitoxin component YwqK of YwqJK toxin-antitoxin module
VSDTVKRIDTRVDDVEWDDAMTLLHNGEPVTGDVVETTVDGFLLSSDHYVDGVLDGTTREWWAGGPLKSEGTARRGRLVGTYREWHDNGALALEKDFDTDGLVVAERRFDENGQPVA